MLLLLHLVPSQSRCYLISIHLNRICFKWPASSHIGARRATFARDKFLIGNLLMSSRTLRVTCQLIKPASLGWASQVTRTSATDNLWFAYIDRLLFAALAELPLFCRCAPELQG